MVCRICLVEGGKQSADGFSIVVYSCLQPIRDDHFTYLAFDHSHTSVMEPKKKIYMVVEVAPRLVSIPDGSSVMI